MKRLSLVIILFALNSFVFAQTAPVEKDGEKEKKEFMENSYLQIDQLDVPKGIKRVEDQLRENVIDVILHSKVHMPIFAQKRQEGYSKDYKKFYGINIRILPITGDEDFYSLQLFYYNWTTNKFDKKLTKKISRYNVLNELRFSMYEILLGKQWVKDHQEQIEERNFERIQAVREVLADSEKRRKKQAKEDAAKKAQEEEEAEKSRNRNLIKREEREKNKKNEVAENAENEQESQPGKSSADESKKMDEVEAVKLEKNSEKEKNSESKSARAKKPKATSPEMVEESAVTEAPMPPVPEEQDPPVPKKTHLYGFANYFQEGVESGGIIPTTTSLKYLGAGGRFMMERQTDHPTGFRVSIQAASPIFKEKYKFPIYRGIESEYYVSKIFDHIKLYGGLDFVPVYFVGLPEAGARLQVYENDFLWGKIGLEAAFNVFERNIELRASYLKSLVAKSNQPGDFSGNKMVMSFYSQIKNNHGAEINFSTMNVTGAFAVSSQKVGLSYIYKFEN